MNFVFYLHNEPSLDLFERKLVWFKQRYNLISYNELYDSIYSHKRLNNACHLTVDDGWLSTYQVIFPVMKKYGIPFTIFVSPTVCLSGQNFWYKDITGVDENYLKEMMITKGLYQKGIEKFPAELLLKEISIDSVYKLLDEYWTINNNKNRQPRGFINVDELKEMYSSNLVEVGAHTISKQILSKEDAHRSEYEIIESISKLASVLNKEITAFAYPNGLKNIDFGQREMNAAKKAGIKMAFSVNPGIINDNVNPLAIPRIGSIRRLHLGYLGTLLPSLAHQSSTRKKIRKYLIK